MSVVSQICQIVANICQPKIWVVGWICPVCQNLVENLINNTSKNSFNIYQFFIFYLKFLKRNSLCFKSWFGLFLTCLVSLAFSQHSRFPNFLKNILKNLIVYWENVISKLGWTCFTNCSTCVKRHNSLIKPPWKPHKFTSSCHMELGSCHGTTLPTLHHY